MCPQSVIDIPDGFAQMRVTSVSEELGGLIRIDGRRTDTDQVVSFVLSPSAHVSVHRTD